MGRAILPRGGGAARVRVPVRGPIARPEDQGVGQGSAGSGQGPGAVGDLPRRGARRARLRAAQARPAERDPRPLPVGAADVRSGRARHRQHGDARGLRHRRAEGALAQADAQPGAVVGVLDDRAPGWLRPEPVPRPTRCATATNGSSPARSGSRAPGGSPTSSSSCARTACSSCPATRPASRSSPSPATTTTSSTTTCGFRSTTCSGPRTAPRCWPSGASAAGASTTRCAPSRSASWPST